MAVDGLEVYDLRVSGVRLNSYAYNVSMTSGLSQLPARDLISIPGPRRDGSVPIPGRYTTPPVIGISGWISDRNPDGTRAANPQVQFQRNWEAFVNAFVSQGATVPVEQCMPDGTIRVADCRVTAAIIPELPEAGASRIAQVQVALEVPDIFWRSTSTFTQTYTTFDTETTLAFLSPSNAPITDGIFKVTGPITNPRISNSYGGFCQYNGTVAAGRDWRVDAKNMTSRIVNTGSPSGPSVLFNTTYFHNAGYLFEVWPSYKVTVSGTGTDANSKWSVTAYKKFL